jgi:hypothetical protein
MRKCKGCSQEIDKYAIACEYCGKLADEREHPVPQDKTTGNGGKKKPEKKQ